jgi:putative DNA methylase
MPQLSGKKRYAIYALWSQKEDEDEALFVDSFTLRAETNGDKKTILDFYPSLKVSLGNKTWLLIDKVEAKKSGIYDKYSELLEIPFTDRYVPLITVGKCTRHGQFFKASDHRDIEKMATASTRVASLTFPGDNGFGVPQGPKSNDLIARGVTHFFDLFSHRQRIYLSEAKRYIDETAPEHRLWLSLLVSTSLEFNSLLCGYKGVDQRRPGAIRHVFSHHAYSFPCTALENNPVFKARTSGTLINLFEKRIINAGLWAKGPIERRWSGVRWEKVMIQGELDLGQECQSLDGFTDKTRAFIVRQNDSSVLPLPDQAIDYVVTDPPYFDNVQYSDLSHFFRCWLHWFLPGQANWQYQPLLSAVSESRENEEKFGGILAKIWQECHRVLVRPHGRLIFTYHHWRAAAWAQLTIALAGARFRLMNGYVVHSENPISVHIRSLRALKHDAILVLKPCDADDIGYWEKPVGIKMDDSASFCRGCAQYLGWILEHDFDHDKICDLWKEFIGSD